MKRILMVTITCIVLTGLLLVSAGCGGGQDVSQEPETETTTVQRGDLTLEITSVGNLELSQTEALAFDMAGTVEEVLVDEGDSVTEGQELVKLDTSEWDDLVKTRERALATAQRALTTAERLIGTKELAVRQEEIDLATAEYNLTQIDAVKEAQDKVDTAEYQVKLAKAVGKYDSESLDDYVARLALLDAAVTKAQQDLQDILSLSNITLSTTVALQIQRYQLLVEQAQRNLEDAQIALENARLDMEDAEEDADDAQANLDEAEALSPIITAPFDGFITNVNVEGGDEVLKGTVAVQLADPDKFEAEILVSEMDILQVELGGTAWVEVDALDGLSLPAKVTHISPTATISSGVVNYKVKVEITSFEALAEQRQDTRQQMMENISPDAIAERMKQAVEEGRITQEQADRFMERMQSGDFPSPPSGGAGFGQESAGAGTGQLPTVVPEDFQLREGLTVTVSLVVDTATNALLVPNAAITTQGMQNYVQVVSANSTDKELITEQRAIEVGITDYSFTEVTSGLSEGEEIIVPKGTSTSVSTQQSRRGGGFFFMGGPR